MEYISREAAIRMRHGCNNDCHKCDFAEEGDSWCQGGLFVVDILRLPAADVVEVVHARPVKFYCDARTGRMITTCSACDLKIGPYDSFCKHCGAKMDGGQDE